MRSKNRTSGNRFQVRLNIICLLLLGGTAYIPWWSAAHLIQLNLMAVCVLLHNTAGVGLCPRTTLDCPCRWWATHTHTRTHTDTHTHRHTHTHTHTHSHKAIHSLTCMWSHMEAQALAMDTLKCTHSHAKWSVVGDAWVLVESWLWRSHATTHTKAAINSGLPELH